MHLQIPPLLTAALAVVVWLVSSARLTRLLTQDAFPPLIKIRAWWDAKTEDSLWNPLLHCHWCAAPWVALVVGGVGWATSLHWAWWVVTVWLSGAYATAWIVHHDED